MREIITQYSCKSDLVIFQFKVSNKLKLPRQIVQIFRRVYIRFTTRVS